VTDPTAGAATTPHKGRLRIAFVYDALVPYLSGGAERRYHALAVRLAERHDVHYVSWRFWGPQPSIVRDGITLHGVGAPRAFYGHDGKRTIREAASFALRLLPVLRRMRVDVVDASATPYLPLYTTWLATRLTGTPLVATWHEFWGQHWADYLPGRPVVARLARLAEAGARPLADRRVAVSAFTARRLLERDALRPAGPGRDAEVDVVGNGVDVATIRAAAPDAQRSDVIHVGRLIDEKHVDRLIRAVAALVGRFPAVRCAIVGDGPERAALEALAAELGISANITFLGRVADERIPGLLRASRILALPSVREGFGIAVVEGQAAGLVPVVARGALSAAPELVCDGEDGVLCDPTIDGLAASLANLLGDEPLRRRLAHAAVRSADARSWDERALEMERIYRTLVAASRRERSDGGRSSPKRGDAPIRPMPAVTGEPEC
jgi:glycosyltransferase involved in cell wall biosynthesis